MIVKPNSVVIVYKRTSNDILKWSIIENNTFSFSHGKKLTCDEWVAFLKELHKDSIIKVLRPGEHFTTNTSLE